MRDLESNEEMALESYRQFQKPMQMDELVFQRVLRGLSTRDYEKAAIQVPEVFGIKKSSISRKLEW